MDDLGSIVLTVVGYVIAPILASLIAIFIWERYREPKLAIKTVKKALGKEPSVQEFKQGPSRAFYHLNVTNEGKSPAYHCKIAMDFSAKVSTTAPFPVTGKWDRSPEPYIEMPVPVEVSPGWMIRHEALEIPQPFILSFSEAIDIQPGQSEPFCVIVKYEGEQECYAFSSWGYLKSRDHRVPEWRLGLGDSDVRISITYSGKKSTVAWFSLNNRGKALDSVDISASAESPRAARQCMTC